MNSIDDYSLQKIDRKIKFIFKTIIYVNILLIV